MVNLKGLVECVEKSCGWEAYKKTQNLYDIDVSKDEEYQRNFVYYYKLRRNAAWKDKFFQYLEKKKNDKGLTFEEVLNHLYKFDNTVEPSFASKLLATINDKMPIWDNNVLDALGLNDNRSRTIKNCVEKYEKIQEEIKRIISDSNECADYLKEFNRVFPNYTEISVEKKIDYILWSKGKTAQQ